MFNQNSFFFMGLTSVVLNGHMTYEATCIP